MKAVAPLVLGSTAEDLRAAVAGENYEHTKTYPEFTKAEEHHEERFRKLLKEVEAGTVFKKDKEARLVCRKCGYVHYGKEPPPKCPSWGTQVATSWSSARSTELIEKESPLFQPASKRIYLKSKNFKCCNTNQYLVNDIGN